jgi:hypothetical protein
MLGIYKYFAYCFRPYVKNHRFKIVIEHLKKNVCILVLNDENRMKIGRKMAEIRTNNER